MEWVEEDQWPVANISFDQGEEWLSVKYEISPGSDQQIHHSGAFDLSKYEDPATELMYRLFG